MLSTTSTASAAASAHETDLGKLNTASGIVDNPMKGRRTLDHDRVGIINELASAKGAIVFASSTGSQYSLEEAKWGHGQAATGSTPRITVHRLDLGVSERVKELTGGPQTLA